MIAAHPAVASRIDRHHLDAIVDEILNHHPALGLAIGVVRDGRLEFFRAHGFADLVSRRPITEETAFRVASITKTFTAIAVMQLVEKGAVDLDAPANDYLRAYKLVPAHPGWRAATVRHLLTHTAGVPQIPHPLRAARTALFSGSPLTEGGGSYRLDETLPTLAEYYQGELRLVTEPGTTFSYGNHSFGTLGQLVEDVSGMPLEVYFREHIFEPLGMSDSGLERSPEVEKRLATGYLMSRRGPRPVVDRVGVAVGAGGAYSTPRDMARYLAALLGGGANEHGRVLEPGTLASMFKPHFQLDRRVAGMGLGFFRGELGGHLVAEHQGVVPGFNSQFFVAPDAATGVMAFTNGSPGALLWMPIECSRLLGQLLGAPEDAIRTDLPQRPELWSGIRGWYALQGQWTDTQARAIGGLGAEVVVRHGELLLRLLGPVPQLWRGLVLHPDDPDDPFVFRVDLSRFELGSMRIVFSSEPDGTATAVHTDLVPLRLERRRGYSNPRRWLTAGATAAVAGGVMLTALRRRSSATTAPRVGISSARLK